MLAVAKTVGQTAGLFDDEVDGLGAAAGDAGLEAEGRSLPRQVYQSHPELWEQFVLEPSGVQILTDRHLAHAPDLSAWRTTRLDSLHVLVEAHDLGPWYATPLRGRDSPDPELMNRALHDFGDMVLTPHRVEQLGL